MKHRDGWTLTQPEPGRFCWRAPLGQRYWTRGEPIAPDLPEPLPAPHDPQKEEAAERDADQLRNQNVGPIFHPSEWEKLRPPDPPPAPEPVDPDTPPPF